MNTQFTWRADKAAKNLLIHGISFEVATNVFSDPHVVYIDDCETDDDVRYHAIGFAGDHMLLVVVYIDLSDSDEEIIHIISARKAEKFEEKLYARQF